MKIYLCPIDGGAPKLLPALSSGDRPCAWPPDGKALYVYKWGFIPADVFLLDVATGTKTLWKTFTPYDPAGIIEAGLIFRTPDGRSWLVTYYQQLADRS